MSSKRKQKRPRIVFNAAQKGEMRDAVEEFANRRLAEKKEKMTVDITNKVAEVAMVAAAVAVFDTFGTAGEELAAFNEKFTKQFDCIIAGTVSLDDLKGMLEVEAFLKTVDVNEIRDPEVPVLVGTGAHRIICWQREIGTIKYWAEKYGLKPQTVRGRLARGWDVEKALTTKAGGVNES